MVILNVDHPDIREFIQSKADEEKKAWALIDAGYDGGFNVPGGAYDSVFFQNANHSVRVTDDFMRAALDDREWKTHAVTTGEALDTFRAKDLLREISEAAHVCGDPGMQYDTMINRWNPVKVTGRIDASNPCSEYMFLDDTACNLASLNLMRFVLGGAPCETFKARELMKQIAEAAWQCGDPGMQFDTTVNAWHTCPNSGRINASNPCSEYMFLDDTACNLASLNLMKFHDAERGFDVESFRHVRDITERKIAEEERVGHAAALARAEELQLSRQRIVSAPRVGSQDIAQQIHGSVQNRLIILLHRLTELEHAAPPGELAPELEALRQKMGDLLDNQVRPISHRLYPSILRRGLVAALQSLGDQFESSLDIEMELNKELVRRERSEPHLILEQVRLAAYRIAEEALTNVVKHTKATKVTIGLRLLPEDWLLDVKIAVSHIRPDDSIFPYIGVVLD